MRPAAQRAITVVADDVHGGAAPASQSVTLALDAVGCVIDLSDEHAGRPRADLVMGSAATAGRTPRAGAGRREHRRGARSGAQ